MSVRNPRKQAMAAGAAFECPIRHPKAPCFETPIGNAEVISERGLRRVAKSGDYIENCKTRKRQSSPHPHRKQGIKGLFKGPTKRAGGTGRESWIKIMGGE